MSHLAGKVAVVTGASKGIGAAIAEELAGHGAATIVNYSSSPRQAEELIAKIKSAGGTAKAFRGDVSKPAEARQLITAAVAEFGRLDILVNNAGVYDFLPLPAITEGHFDRIFDLNVKGLLFATQLPRTPWMGTAGQWSTSDPWHRCRRHRGRRSTARVRAQWRSSPGAWRPSSDHGTFW